MRQDNRDTFYNKKRNFPHAEEREFDNLSSIPATLYRKGALKKRGILGTLKTGKGKHGINLTCRLLPPKEGDAGEIRIMLSKTKRDLGEFPLEPGCQLVLYDGVYNVVDYRFNSFPKYAVLLLTSAY